MTSGGSLRQVVFKDCLEVAGQIVGHNARRF